MEKNPPRPMTPFDELVTPTSLYTLKLLLPYVPVPMQRIVAIFLKFYELKNTIENFHGFNCSCTDDRPDSIIKDLKPYMKPEEQEMMEQMENMMNMMEMMKQVQNASDFASSDNSEGFSPLNLMKGMMDPEQQNMFEMYSHIFDQAMDHSDSQKGADYE
ncbi:MAG: hypothetical protein ACI4S2_13925 [Lachnospiraceae bacterium]